MKAAIHYSRWMLCRWTLMWVVCVGSLVGCTSLLLDSEQECDAKGTCRDTYLSKSLSGRAVTPEETLGVHAIATVSARGHGTLQLTFYRLGETSEEYRVRDVAFLGPRTMTEGRAIAFGANAVSETVRGEFAYSAYFPAIPIDVQLVSSLHSYSCYIRLEFTRTHRYTDALQAEPVIPRTVPEFLALPPPAPRPVNLNNPDAPEATCIAVPRGDT